MKALFLCATFVAASFAGCSAPPADDEPEGEATAAPSPGQERVLADGWLQFHPNWTRGGTHTWLGRTYEVDEDEEWASDGSMYWYGRAMYAGENETRCRTESPPAPAEHPWVFIAFDWQVEGCIWAAMPGSGCYRARFCRPEMLSRGGMTPPT